MSEEVIIELRLFPMCAGRYRSVWGSIYFDGEKVFRSMSFDSQYGKLMIEFFFGEPVEFGADEEGVFIRFRTTMEKVDFLRFLDGLDKNAIRKCIEKARDKGISYVYAEKFFKSLK